MNKTNLSILISIILLFVLSVTSATALLAQDGTTLTAVRVEAVSPDPLDAAWSAVPSLNIALLGDGIEPSIRNGITFDLVQTVDLQAVYTDDTIAIRAVWSDATQNDNRGYWTYTESG